MSTPGRVPPSGCMPPTGEPLVGRVVRLDVMRAEDAPGLFEVYGDPRCYEHGYLMTTPPGSLADTERVVAAHVRAREAGRTAYTVRLVADSALGPAGTVVGTSSLGDVDLEREHVHLGWTIYGSRWWGTAVNPETKLLLLTHAFDTCGFGRVRIQTDVRNERSRAAIERLGARFEGVTRRDVRRADGSWRDTAVHSVLVEEWPQVRAGLVARLAGHPGGQIG
ncbi:MAG TPA: GNAT family protein [Intrasporangium sp.]|uniref:GNAT family N-acetyltransferase n=1 Tax=Intrasporangium sp. TaxID=1925024 RepID=UPI002D778EF5|nr:GNAT family protein [Intrasporangium sp.]HET7398746.1 GNAT family protein [Intrasporangium sp.]